MYYAAIVLRAVVAASCIVGSLALGLTGSSVLLAYVLLSIAVVAGADGWRLIRAGSELTSGRD
jgi:hypothetical protein